MVVIYNWRMPKGIESDFLSRFGGVIKARREELGLSQETLATRAELHRSYIGDVERGRRNVALRNVERLAAALELTIPELFKRVDRGS